MERRVSDGELFLGRFFGPDGPGEGAGGNGAGWVKQGEADEEGAAFGNLGNGDLRGYSYSYVGFFFLGVFCLLYKGKLRLTVRLLLAMLEIFVPWAYASQASLVDFAFDPEYGVGSLLFFLALLAVQV